MTCPSAAPTATSFASKRKWCIGRWKSQCDAASILHSAIKPHDSNRSTAIARRTQCVLRNKRARFIHSFRFHYRQAGEHHSLLCLLESFGVDWSLGKFDHKVDGIHRNKRAGMENGQSSHTRPSIPTFFQSCRPAENLSQELKISDSQRILRDIQRPAPKWVVTLPFI